jgi:hypothetical protein
MGRGSVQIQFESDSFQSASSPFISGSITNVLALGKTPNKDLFAANQRR